MKKNEIISIIAAALIVGTLIVLSSCAKSPVELRDNKTTIAINN